jgi:DNA-binding LytR/AlgR family response regulator
MLRIMVCDDEYFIFEQIKERILTYCIKRNLECEINYCATAKELQEAPFDYNILFLDIMLDAGMDGICIGKQLRDAGNTALFCIITSRRDRAIDGYEANVFRYLVKPLCEEEFHRTFDALMDILEYNRDIIRVKFKYQTTYIYVKDIIYVESYLRKRYVVTKSGQYQTTASWQVLMEQFLEYHCFFCPKKTYLINLWHVSSQSSAGLTMNNGVQIKFAAGKHEQFLSVFAAFLNGGG